VNITNTVKGKSSAGFDEIPEFLVKGKFTLYLKKNDTHIFNMLVKFGIFPYLIKTAKNRPLFKKGDKLDIQNFRPITILSIFSKILEKVMYHGLLSFLTKKKSSVF
jgi:hypothetical protein